MGKDKKKKKDKVSSAATRRIEIESITLIVMGSSVFPCQRRAPLFISLSTWQLHFWMGSSVFPCQRRFV